MRRRLVIAIVAVVAAVMTVFAIPLLVDEGERIRIASDRDLREDADAVASRLRRLSDISTATATDLSIASAPELHAAVYSTAGKLLAGKGPSNGGTPVRQAALGDPASTTIDGHRVRTEPIVRDGSIVAVLRVGDPVSEINAAILRRRLTLLGAVAGALGAAAVLAVLLSRRLLRPIEPMIAAARRLQNGDFTVRTSPTGLRELDALGAALNDAAGRIGALVDRERAFSADVAHQLRTPITSLKAAIETEQVAPREDAFLVLDELMGDVDRLESTVGGLLALRRDAPKDRNVVPVRAIVDDLEAVYRPQLALKTRRIVTNTASKLPPVRASRSAIEQILSILLANSVVHGAGRVTVSAEPYSLSDPEVPGVAVTVSDEGPGITGDLDTLFRRRVSGGSGSGIGLSLAASLAFAEGATLTLVAPGPQPTFRLVIPGSPHENGELDNSAATLRADRQGTTSR